MKVILTKVYRSKVDKDNKPLTTKDGRNYEKVGILTKEHGDKQWLSGFGNKDNEGWKEGDTVEVDVVQKGQYLNFSMPKKFVTREEFEDLKLMVQHIANKVFDGMLPVDEDPKDSANQEIPF
jgi:hypothetical protein